MIQCMLSMITEAEWLRSRPSIAWVWVWKCVRTYARKVHRGFDASWGLHATFMSAISRIRTARKLSRFLKAGGPTGNPVWNRQLFSVLIFEKIKLYKRLYLELLFSFGFSCCLSLQWIHRLYSMPVRQCRAHLPECISSHSYIASSFDLDDQFTISEVDEVLWNLSYSHHSIVAVKSDGHGLHDVATISCCSRITFDHVLESMFIICFLYREQWFFYGSAWVGQSFS